jgi:hypothetical protein
MSKACPEVEALLEAAVLRDFPAVLACWESVVASNAATGPYQLLRRLCDRSLFLHRGDGVFAASPCAELGSQERDVLQRAAEDLREICAALDVEQPVVVLAFGTGCPFPMKSTEARNLQCAWVPDSPQMRTRSVIGHELAHCVLQSGVPLLDEGLAVFFQKRFGGSVGEIPGTRGPAARSAMPTLRRLLQSNRSGTTFAFEQAGDDVAQLYELAAEFVAELVGKLGMHGLASLYGGIRTVPELARNESLRDRLGIAPGESMSALALFAPDELIEESRVESLHAAYMAALNSPAENGRFLANLSEAVQLAEAAGLSRPGRNVLLRSLAFHAMTLMAEGKETSAARAALRRHYQAGVFLEGNDYSTMLAEAVFHLCGGFQSRRFIDPVLVGLARTRLLAAASEPDAGPEAILYLHALETWMPGSFSRHQRTDSVLLMNADEIAACKLRFPGVSRFCLVSRSGGSSP